MMRRRGAAVNHSPKLDDDMLALALFGARRLAFSRAPFPVATGRITLSPDARFVAFSRADYSVIHHLTHLSP